MSWIPIALSKLLNAKDSSKPAGRAPNYVTCQKWQQRQTQSHGCVLSIYLPLQDQDMLLSQSYTIFPLFPKHNVHRDHGASESVQTIGHHEGGSEECSNDTKTKASTRAEGVKRRPRHEGGGEECWRSKNTTSTKAQGVK